MEGLGLHRSWGVKLAMLLPKSVFQTQLDAIFVDSYEVDNAPNELLGEE